MSLTYHINLHFVLISFASLDEVAALRREVVELLHVVFGASLHSGAVGCCVVECKLGLHPPMRLVANFNHYAALLGVLVHDPDHLAGIRRFYVDSSRVL